MTLEEAITLAIEYETRVRDAYLEAVKGTDSEVGKRVFNVLGDEEQGHIDFLKSRLDEWKRTGKVTPETMSTVVPSQAVVEAGIKKLDQHMARKDYGVELQMLQKALDMEIETSNFYRKMVGEMGDDGALFARFLEIEEGHQAIVQAEIDYLSRSGTLFDFQEFTQED